MNDGPSIFDRLMRVIEDRKANPNERSYTARLLAGGVDAIGAKIQEEAGEVVEAARGSSPGRHAEVVHEAADVVYHLWVLLAQQNVPLADVEAELRRRFGTSGLDEKASRTS